MIRDGAKRLTLVTDTDIYGFFQQYRFLSNFEVCKITLEGLTYNSSEAAYMAYKTLDLDTRATFANITEPSVARRMGRTVKLRGDWNDVRIAVMTQAIHAKFTQNPKLSALLKETGLKELHESNDWKDTFWGVTKDPATGLWVGSDNLGKIIMQVRSSI